LRLEGRYMYEYTLMSPEMQEGDSLWGVSKHVFYQTAHHAAAAPSVKLLPLRISHYPFRIALARIVSDAREFNRNIEQAAHVILSLLNVSGGCHVPNV